MVKKFSNNRPAEIVQLDRLLKKEGGQKIDHFDLYLKDLFEIRHPHLYKNSSKEEVDTFKNQFLKEKPENAGIWVYYPWLKTAYLCPPEDAFFEIITARNKTLVSDFEQKEFYNFNVGIVGMSVGQSAALMLVRSGGSRNLKIADSDTVDPSNLNRIHVGVPAVGRAKVDVVAERICETNPYTNLKKYNEDLTLDNLEEFFNDDFKLNVVVDACDNILIKIAIRKLAKKLRIPVLMVTDIGDGALVDIERFDLDDKLPIFHGRIEEEVEIKTREDFMKAGMKIIDPDNLSLNTISAMASVGKEIPTHPQLGTSAYFSGVVMSYIIRRLSAGEVFPTKRSFVDLEAYFNPKIQTEEYKILRNEAVTNFKKMLGL